MSAKDSIATQTCELSKEESIDFLNLYPTPSEYRVILPKSNQTVFDAPAGNGFQNFIYTEAVKDLLFLPKEPSLGFNTGSPSVLVNTEPLKANEELVIRLAEIMADSREILKPELFVVHRRSIADQIKDRKCKTRDGSSRPPVNLPNVLKLKDATACRLKIFTITPPAWKNHLDNHMDVELLDLHDHCYARHDVVDNDKERAREEECEELQAKYEAAMTEFEPYCYQQSLLTLESNVTYLDAKKASLEAVEVSLRKQVEELKHDRREVVLKFIPYVVMELVHSDDMGSLIVRLVSSPILYRRCKAYEQVSDMKEPFYLSKVKGYRSSYKKDHTHASNDLAIVTFPWLDEFMADPPAHIEALLSKKPPSLQRPSHSRTQVSLTSSQRATPSSIPISNLVMSSFEVLLITIHEPIVQRGLGVGVNMSGYKSIGYMCTTSTNHRGWISRSGSTIRKWRISRGSGGKHGGSNMWSFIAIDVGYIGWCRETRWRRHFSSVSHAENVGFDRIEEFLVLNNFNVKPEANLKDIVKVLKWLTVE
uniref:Uncharacterized protein n=1 Tax=Tanacetum cinerariifolium TaxID=118510 RepID=A0A6L2JKG8_TANCI|nr:hypothetical protein [Tanacetum cinerariifolium]